MDTTKIKTFLVENQTNLAIAVVVLVIAYAIYQQRGSAPLQRKGRPKLAVSE